MSRDQFLDDRKTQSAVLHSLQIIGEAASNVSDARRASMTDIPWSEMTGMRHRLVHDYRNVNLNIAWDVVTEDLPRLLETLEPHVSPDQGR